MLDLLLYAFLPALVGATGACLALFIFAKAWEFAFGGRAMRPRALPRR